MLKKDGLFKKMRNGGSMEENSTQFVYTSYIAEKFSFINNDDGTYSLILWIKNLAPKPPHLMLVPFWPCFVEEEREIRLSQEQLQEFVDFCLASGAVSPNPRYTSAQTAQNSDSST